MEKRYYSALELREMQAEMIGFVRVDYPGCDYCGKGRERDKYHPELCAYCGAVLYPHLIHVVMDPVTGIEYEAIVDPSKPNVPKPAVSRFEWLKKMLELWKIHK